MEEGESFCITDENSVSSNEEPDFEFTSFTGVNLSEDRGPGSFETSQRQKRAPKRYGYSSGSDQDEKTGPDQERERDNNWEQQKNPQKSSIKILDVTSNSTLKTQKLSEDVEQNDCELSSFLNSINEGQLDTILLIKILKGVEMINRKCNYLIKKNSEMSKKLHDVTEFLRRGHINDEKLNKHFDLICERLKLPISSVEDLNNANSQLEDKELSGSLTQFLSCAGTGRKPRNFLMNTSRRLLTSEVASQYSRIGRKGKKSFYLLENITNVILTAAAIRFPNKTREDLDESFGLCLSSAPYWNKVRPKKIKETNNLKSER